jgi:hypothetical protein
VIPWKWSFEMKEALCRVSDEPFHISDVLVLLVGQQLWGQNMQDLGICEGEEEGDPCEGFSMADVDFSFDNYEDIFSSTQDLSSSSFDNIEAGCTSMGQDSAGEHMQSIPESELFELTNVSFLTECNICSCE